MTKTTKLEEYINLSSYDDKFLSKAEEKIALEKSIAEWGFTIETARQLIESYCRKNNIVNERLLDGEIISLLKGACSDGSISQKEFNSIFEGIKSSIKLDDNKIKQKIKSLIIENQFAVKEGGFFGTKWFSNM